MQTEAILQLVANHRAEARADDSGCFQKAQKRGDTTFTLVGQDRSSPKVIAYWILENIETAPAEKLVDAVLDAIIMRQNPSRRAAD